MRALKTLLIILLAVIALAVILGLVGPKHAHIQRETMIAAPTAVVWDHVNTLRKEDEWSPFRDQDPDLVVTFEGTDGEVGSKSMWEGKKSGKGMQTITAVDTGRHIGVALHFIAPFEGEAKGDIQLEPMGDSTKVTWSYDGDNNFVARIICVFKDMDAMMGPVFANGLAKLKAVCEADAAKRAEDLKARTFRGYVIDTIDRPAMVYMGKRSVVKWDKIGAFFGNVFPQASQAAAKAGLRMEGHPSGLFYTWDEAGKQTDMFAGIPVAPGSDTAKVQGFAMVTVPSGKALMIAYHGAYDQSEDAHEAMNDMMKADHLELRDAVTEEYITDPMQEPDTAKWLTNIYYPIK
jgi:effector-binding domain-containing protein